MRVKYMPLLLIAFGVGFLLYNLKIISFTPWALLWPALIIWLGISQLIQIKKRQRGAEDSWEIALWLIISTIGIYMLLPAIGISTPSIPWRTFWPLILILIGIFRLLPGRCSFIRMDKGTYHQTSRTYEHESKYALVGEFNRGPGNWVLNDLDIRQGVGSINLDLTQAIIPDREVHLDISGFVGDANIYLPPGLPFKAECSISIGDITVLEHNESGGHRYVNTQSPDYESATRKVNIVIHWRIGDINIRQIR